jgi:hypothetical protein
MCFLGFSAPGGYFFGVKYESLWFFIKGWWERDLHGALRTTHAWWLGFLFRFETKHVYH